MAPNLPSPPPARGGSRALACWAPGTWEGLSSVVPCKWWPCWHHTRCPQPFLTWVLDT